MGENKSKKDQEKISQLETQLLNSTQTISNTHELKLKVVDLENQSCRDKDKIAELVSLRIEDNDRFEALESQIIKIQQKLIVLSNREDYSNDITNDSILDIDNEHGNNPLRDVSSSSNILNIGNKYTIHEIKDKEVKLIDELGEESIEYSKRGFILMDKNMDKSDNSHLKRSLKILENKRRKKNFFENM